MLIAVPMALILRQPDLGTAVLLGATGMAIIFLAGVSWRVIGGAMLASFIAIPLFFRFALKPYQRDRILTFLDPSRDPTGASYHITQSKIALGSGGVTGKGYMKGTQRQGEYVPENRTDFIFTVIGEEFGLIGSLMTIGLYITVIGICLWLAWQCKNAFSKLLILGLTTTFTLYIFINLAMVMGLAPVVGVPLPLISYGGTVILAVMAGFGLVLSAHLYRNVELPRSHF
jgi:rod shape determining protein RodA